MRGGSRGRKLCRGDSGRQGAGAVVIGGNQDVSVPANWVLYSS
jgi:hypothetical protein